MRINIEIADMTELERDSINKLKLLIPELIDVVDGDPDDDMNTIVIINKRKQL